MHAALQFFFRLAFHICPMKGLLLSFFFVFAYCAAHAQVVYKVVVRDGASGELLDGVSVSIKDSPGRGTVTDASGSALVRGLKPGSYTILFTLIGYKDTAQTIEMPDTALHSISMVADAKALHDVVVVSSTRSNARIEHATTKVEVLGQEEMNEESTLKPGNIASILGDVSGVQIQQSSAVSGNANVRIQGLDGRYTQILRDGMPLYGGYAGGFGVLTIPPLDLRQIELIKGSSSTLYGGGAIAGLINLISKKPAYTPDASVLVNQSTLKETNLNAYYAQRWKHAGVTFFGGQTFQKAVDVDKDGFSDVPDTKSTLLHPTLFLYPSEHSWISLGWSGSFEKRTGGDMIAVAGGKDSAHPYFEKNKLDRNAFTLLSESRLSSALILSVKGSLSIFQRAETTDTYFFRGQQNNYYGEVSLTARAHRHFITGGINITGDRFMPAAATPVPVGAFSNRIPGIFLQDNWQLSAATRLEAGIRADHPNGFGTIVLPRVALFNRLDEHWDIRAGFGMGYITPNPLTPQLKDFSIYQIMPIGKDVSPEKSYSGNAEVNYKMSVGKAGTLFINQAFFLTRINHPIVGTGTAAGALQFANKDQPLITRGSDTYVQLHLPSLEFYLGYTYVDALQKYTPQNVGVPLTPRHRAAATALYEKEGDWRVGLEASYNGFQYREDYTHTPSYVFVAVMAEKKFGPQWSVVLNCENLLDARQSKYEQLYTGTIANPSFKALWGPIDGRIVNLCLRWQPFANGK
jgi:outer membrane receptor for ferrienterochelin and colicins